MNLVSYLDNDALNKPRTGAGQVYSLDSTTTTVKNQLVAQYPNVFGPGIGLLEGKYHIIIDSTHVPVQHTPRRIPVAIREQLKNTLEDLTKDPELACWKVNTILLLIAHMSQCNTHQGVSQ